MENDKENRMLYCAAQHSERVNKMDLEPKELKISPMQKTWILDLDGTLLVHDGPYIMGKDEFLPGARQFLDSIPKGLCKTILLFPQVAFGFLLDTSWMYKPILFHQTKYLRFRNGRHIRQSLL